MLTTEHIAAALLEQQRSGGFAGYDPFDGLNSKLFNFLGLNRSALLRLAWLQFHKRSPINFRPLVLVPERRNPKGIALFILGLLNDFRRTNDESYLSTALDLCDWLVENRLSKEDWGGACWGYHFPWQARAFYVPLGTPNVITTLYCSRALHQASLFDCPGAAVYRETALSSANFIAEHLFSTDDNDEPYIAYIPGENAFVHNASLWGAAWLVYCGVQLDQQAWITLGKQVVDRSVSAQGKEGEWPYGSLPHHQFIDGFHTGYNLEAIKLVSETLNTNEYDECLRKGLSFYRNNFFGPNGEPNYYLDNPFPYDVHSSAQAVITLLKVSGTRADSYLAHKIIKWTVDNMYLAKKSCFKYQICRQYENRINYVRWTQGWAYLMLTEWNSL